MAHVRMSFRPALIALAIAAASVAALILLSSASASDDDPSKGDVRRHEGRILRELPELRTANSRTYATSARTQVTRAFAHPVNFRSDGKWVAIDPSLEPSDAPGVALENAAAPFAVELPDSLSDPVEVREGDDYVRFALQGARGVGPQGGGLEARYVDALPGVDVAYESTPSALKESLVLESPDAGSKFTFTVDTSEGLSARENAAGGIDFVRDGRVRLSFSPPHMRDSARVPEVSTDVSYDLRDSGAGYEVVLRADRDWLAGATYPVAIDPTTNIDTNDDCYMVSGSDANAGFCGYTDPYIQIGKDGLNNIRRAFMRVDTTAIPKTAEVLEGELHTYVESGTQRNVDLHRVTRQSTSARTWNKYDGTNAWTNPGGDYDSTPSGSESAYGGAVGTERINARKLVQGWVDGSTPNYGLILKDNGTTTGVVTITGDAASNDPFLEVEWAHRTGEQDRWTFSEHGLSDRANLKANVANGNLLLEEADIHIPGVAGHDLEFTRSWNNLEFDTSSSTDDLGRYWRGSVGYDVWLRSSGLGTTQNFNGPSDFWAPYDRQSNGTDYDPPTGMNADLKKNTADGTHTLTYRESNMKLKFASNGELMHEEDRNGNKITYAYNGTGGKLLSVKDTHDQGTANNTLTFTYTGAGYIDKITDRSSPTVRTWDYNYTGNLLTSYVNPDGKTTTYSYDASENLDKVTDSRGTVTDIDYDSQHRVVSIQRDEANAGPETKFEYPTTLSTQCQGVGSGEQTVVGETIEKDPLWTSGTAHTTKYCWDKLLRVQKTIDGRNKERKTGYTPNSDVNKITSAGGQAWDMQYTNDRADQAESPPTTSGGSRMTQKFGYDSAVTDKSNQAFWLQKRLEDERGNVYTYGHDAKGNLTDINLPLATQNNIHLTVNTNGTTASVRDANGTGTTSFGYTNGNLTSVDRQNTTGSTNPQLGTELFTYDAVHRVSTHQDGAAQTATFTYDPLDRATNIAHSGSRGSANVAYGYDSNGNMTSRVDGTGTSTYTYDRLNRLTQEALPNGTTSYTYDAAGNMKTLVDGGGTTTYNYGASNLLDSMQAPGDTAATTFDYTDDGTRKTTTYPNGVVMEATWEDGSSGNLGPGRLKKIRAHKSGTTLTSFEYGYTPSAGCSTGSADSSLRHSLTTPSGTATYCYDPMNRLKSATNHNSKNYTYTLDGNGNIKQAVRDGTTTTFGFNEADQLCWSVNASHASSACNQTPTGRTTYLHDAEGNLVSSSAGFSATYNVREQALTMTSLTGTNSTGMVYSGPNQFERVTAGAKTYLNNALGVSAETSGGVTTRFRRDDEGGLVSERLGTTGNPIHYYVFDGLGSVAGMSDAAGTAPLPTTYSYDPYGLTSTSGSNPNPWKYAATYDDPTGFYKMGLRYYHPSLMRWSQRDPVEQLTDPVQAMLYSYAGGDPVNSADPGGAALPAILAAGASIAVRAAPVIARVAPVAIRAARPLRGLRARVGNHGPHHSFRIGRIDLGRRRHLQMNLWIKGSKGSGVTPPRIPYGRRYP